MRKWAGRLLALALAVGCGLAGGAARAAEEVPEAERVFYEGWDTVDANRVFYEIFVGSFSDGNGDGIGDLRGIINRLDYLNDGDPASGKSLGVEGLWLTPVFASPSYHKYDVTDYYAIDPDFGTMDDLKELIEKAHARGMIVILDLPLNHTGDESPWFTRFENAHITNNEGNRYYDFYKWIPEGETPPAGRNFVAVPGAGVRVEANFDSHMPELDFDQEAVRQAVLDVARFYLDLGADGFRLDAAKYVYFGDHEKNVAFWKWFAGEVKKVRPDAYLVAEVWDGEGITDRYQEALNCFNFATSQGEGLIAQTAKAGDANRFTAYIQKRLERITGIQPEAINILFISNHDMDRAAGYLTVASGQMKMAANLYLLSPGSPFIYYGEEIGMRGSRGSAWTDANRRLAMLWGDGDTVKDPPESDYTKQSPYSVQDLYGFENSLYYHYRHVIQIRRANPEIARGAYQALRFEGTKVGGFISEWNGSRVAVIHNPSGKDQTIDLTSVADGAFSKLCDTAGEGGAALEGTVLTIGAQTSVVLR